MQNLMQRLGMRRAYRSSTASSRAAIRTRRRSRGAQLRHPQATSSSTTNVLNKQREVIYTRRRDLLRATI